MNRLIKYVAAGSLAVGAIALLSPAVLVAQMSQGGLDAPTTPPPAMGDDQPTTKPADETGAMVESPIYASWKGKAVGSSVTYAMTATQGTQVQSVKMVNTLKEITDSKVVCTQSSSAAGQEKSEENEQTFEAKVPAASKWDVTGDGLKWTEAGTEKITVLGKEYECTKLTTKLEQMGTSLSGTAYYTKEVMGGLVKADIEANGPQGAGKLSIVIDSISEK